MSPRLILLFALCPGCAQASQDTRVVRLWKQPPPRFGFLGVGRKEFLSIWCVKSEPGPMVCVSYRAYTSAKADPNLSELCRFDLNTGKLISRTKLDYDIFNIPEKYRSEPADSALAMNFDVDGGGIEFASN